MSILGGMEPIRAAEPPVCEHHWASIHRPGHRFYWIRQCQLCHEVDWDDLDVQADEYAATVIKITDEEDPA